MSDSVGSVSVEVVPDARGWSEKLRAQIRDQKVTVQADADTTEANAQLDEAARTRTAKIKTDVSQLSQGASMLDQFVGQLGLLPSLAIAAGAALVPLGAALVGVTAALGAPLAIAGGGATLFALLGGAAVAQTQKQLKVIDSLQKKVDGATKGTKAYAQAQKELRDAQKALTPEQTKFQSNISKLGAAFQNFLGGKSGSQLLSVVNQGIGLLIKLLPLAAPLISAVGDAFKTLLDELDRGAGSQGFATFIHKLANRVGPDLVAFAHIGGNAIKGITGILLGLGAAFNNTGKGGLLHGLEDLSGKFADLGSKAGKSQWLQDFVAYVHKVGPGVADTLGSLARSFGHIVAALAPLGPPVLRIIKGIADAFNSIPIPVLTGIAGAAAGLVAFQKLGGLKATSAVSKFLLASPAAALTPGSVQKVAVTNWPPGLGGGGGAVTELSRLAKYGPWAAVGAIIAATVWSQFKIIKAESTPGPVNVAGMTPLQWDVYNRTGTKVSANKAVKQDLAPLNSMIGLPQIRSSTTALDALKAHAQSATRTLDLIGPHIHQTMAGADSDVNRFQGVLNSLHDKRIKVIADTASAIASLQHLQALRIQDKYFNVYQRNLLLEQAVGPGGGIGRHNVPGVGGGSGGAGRGPTHVHLHLDDGSGRTLHGVISEGADQVYHANRAYEDARAGR